MRLVLWIFRRCVSGGAVPGGAASLAVRMRLLAAFLTTANTSYRADSAVWLFRPVVRLAARSGGLTRNHETDWSLLGHLPSASQWDDEGVHTGRDGGLPWQDLIGV